MLARSRRWLYSALPGVFTLWVYWAILRAWFLADDFVWLGLLNDVHHLPDLWAALFRPTVQGTLRPWSDRVFFLVFRALFDLDAFPYHAWMFGTQIAAGLLMMSVVRRLTGSKEAGVAAPIFWTGNAVLVMTMAWVCLYKDVLCTLTLLLAFHFLLRYIETGRERYNAWQWIVFVLGFGVMETNVVYPGIAIGYAVLCARPYLRKTLPLLAGSAVYLALSAIFIHKPATGPYRMHIDWHLPKRLLEYWIVVLSPTSRLEFPWTYLVIPAVLTACLAAFVVARWRSGDRLPIFFLLWFGLTIAPVLPLREHFETYYLTVAAAGIAMLAAHAFAVAWQSKRAVWKGLVLALALVFLVPSVRLARFHARFWRDRGRHAESVVLGASEAREKHPDRTIVLDGVDTQLFWDIFPDGAFRAAEVSGVYLTPGAVSQIRRLRPEPAPAQFALPPAAMRDPERLLVYDASSIPLREVTRAYFETLPDASGLPARIDLESTLANPFLSGTWHEPEQGPRWMGRQAGLRLAAPQQSDRKLRVFAYCPENVAAAGAVTLNVSVNGTPMPPAHLQIGDVELLFPIPAGAEAKPALDVTLTVGRTIRAPGDDRELGLPIRVVEIR